MSTPERRTEMCSSTSIRRLEQVDRLTVVLSLRVVPQARDVDGVGSLGELLSLARAPTPYVLAGQHRSPGHCAAAASLWSLHSHRGSPATVNPSSVMDRRTGARALMLVTTSSSVMTRTRVSSPVQRVA